MGLVDALAAEDRVQVMMSEYKSLVRAERDAEYLKNAITAEVPREQVIKCFTGKNDELEEYRKTELTPEQIRDMDRFYAEKCVELAVVRAQKDLAEKQLADLKEKLAELVNGKKTTQQDGEKNDGK